MKYIQESAIIPDEVIEEAFDSPYNRVGNWAKKNFLYGDDMQKRPGARAPGVIGKVNKFFTDPAKYEADKEQFQGERAANWLYAQLGPVIQQGKEVDPVTNEPRGVDVDELLKRLTVLDAKPGVKYSEIENNLPTIINLKKRRDVPFDPKDIIDLLKNIGIETVKAFAMGATKDVPAVVEHEPTTDYIINLLKNSKLDDYQKSLIIAAAFKTLHRIDYE